MTRVLPLGIMTRVSISARVEVIDAVSYAADVLVTVPAQRETIRA